MDSRLSKDVLVIGAGPAGLTAAARLIQAGLDVAVCDLGDPVARRPSDVRIGSAVGVGGAGLYSDGKVSFHPSATELWRLEPADDLGLAYEEFRSLLPTDREWPDLPPNGDRPVAGPTLKSTEVREKRYRSEYLTIDERAAMIEALSRIVAARLTTNARVELLDTGTRPKASIVAADRTVEVAADAIAVASGRFGGRSLAVEKGTFRRIEIGVRIEQSADSFFLDRSYGTDPKLIVEDRERPDLHWRTFCCCRDGLVVTTEFDGLTTVSGRADCPATGRSNVGFNLRFSSPDSDLARTAASWLSTIDSSQAPVAEPIEQFLSASAAGSSPLTALFGRDLSSAIADGLRRLDRATDGRVLKGGVLHGPAIEGMGRYPALDRELRVPHSNVWVAGDATGAFRGLTAALVSGFFVARRVESALSREGR